MEDDFDFENEYADDFDALREMEMEMEASERGLTQKKITSSAAVSQPQSSSAESCLQTSSREKAKSTTTNGLHQLHKSQSDPVSALNKDNQTSKRLKNGLSREEQEDTLSERRAKKRDIEEMFGPLSDSEDELVIDAPLPTLTPTAKRARKLFPDSNKTADKSTITPPASPTANEKILQQVQRHREQAVPQGQTLDHKRALSTGALQHPDRPVGYRRLQILLREPPGLSARLTSQDGRRVYLRMKEVETVEDKMKGKTVSKRSRAGPLRLLSTPIELMRDELENERHERLMKDADSISSRLTRDLAKKLDMVEAEEADDEREDEEEVEEKSSALWVDQYAPKRYTDLLSDDGINRNLLFWLKLWDMLVFGKERKQRKKTHQQQQQQQQQQKQPDGKDPKQFKNNFKNKFQQEEVQEELDAQNRPVHKIALLCGPPGLGKTTLAHIIARHAGYNVVEMNASDDRSVDVFKNKLESSTQMKSVLTKERRPNCLVIDEIDGAPTPAINCLLAFIKGSSEGAVPAAAPSTKKKKPKLLLRPIICICNDPYVPALRQLRQVAFVTHFPSTLTTRLASRLNQIAKNNSLRTDMTALMALCNKADNDIRSCLNTLQFIHSQGRVLSLGHVHSLSVGQKDKNKGFFAIWQEIFKLPVAKKKQYANPHDVAAGKATLGLSMDGTNDKKNPTSMTERFYNMVQLAQSAGDYDKLLQGIFENYLEVKFKDPRLEAVNLANDWLIFHDQLSSIIAHSQNYTFYRYLPYIPVTFHLLFASSGQQRLKYPNSSYENFTKQTKNSNLLTTVLTGVSPNTACFLDPRLSVQEVLPLLLIILQPTFRPVNTQLFSAQEKRQMKELINSMIAYNLTYNQERSAEGQYNYVLDPNLDSVVRFSSTPQTKQMTYAAKQLIAREISLEKMRRSEAAIGGKNGPNESSKKAVKVTAGAKKDGSVGSKVPRHLEKLQPKKIQEEEEKPLRDFFGRIIKKKSPGPKTGDSDQGGTSMDTSQKDKASTRQEQQQQLSGKLWYKFNQGYSNAVRKTVRIQDLL